MFHSRFNYLAHLPVHRVLAHHALRPGPEVLGRLVADAVGLDGQDLQDALGDVAHHGHPAEGVEVADDEPPAVPVGDRGERVSRPLAPEAVEAGYRAAPEVGGEGAHGVLRVLDVLFGFPTESK